MIPIVRCAPLANAFSTKVCIIQPGLGDDTEVSYRFHLSLPIDSLICLFVYIVFTVPDPIVVCWIAKCHHSPSMSTRVGGRCFDCRLDPVFLQAGEGAVTRADHGPTRTR